MAIHTFVSLDITEKELPTNDVSVKMTEMWLTKAKFCNGVYLCGLVLIKSDDV